KVLDFNGDGFPDFSVEYYPPDTGLGRGLAPSQPLIYLNDGRGHFSTLRVGDFVAPGSERVLGGGHLVQTRSGYSFFTPYLQPGQSGLHLTGLLATRPFRASAWRIAPAPAGGPGPRKRAPRG